MPTAQIEIGFATQGKFIKILGVILKFLKLYADNNFTN